LYIGINTLSRQKCRAEQSYFWIETSKFTCESQ